VAKKKSQHRSPATVAAPTHNTTDWIKIVGVLLAIAGVLNLLEGIGALTKDSLFNDNKLLFGEVKTWGWIYLGLGALQLWAAALVIRRHASGMIMAITFASVSGIAHFLQIGAFPIWSLIVMAIDFGVLFVLLTRSDEFA
jgi:hypothetical protein